MWPIYNITIIQDEGGKTYTKLTYTISKWSIEKLLIWEWFKDTPKIDHLFCKSTWDLQNTRYD
jgi:hypothetical protein